MLKVYLEVVVEVESVEVVPMMDIEQPEKVLQGLGLLLVIHGQDEVQVSFVIHFLLVRHALLEDPLDKHPR